MYFFWQLGAVRYLRQHYDLERVPMAGASSGGVVACLAACGVDPDRIFDAAYTLAVENDIWNRKLGLLGIWGGLLRRWLDELLPDNAHELASGRLHVVIAKAPTLGLFEVRSAICRILPADLTWPVVTDILWLLQGEWLCH
jgi:predicted acylesterase/phospholipase RssA